MSQSATLYRVSETFFQQLAQSKERHFDTAAAKDHVLFQGSFMGLEYVLAKNEYAATASLLHALFHPKHMLGSEVLESSVSMEGQIEFFEVPLLYPYHTPDFIAQLHAFLETVSAEDIRARYNAEELNNNNVYPSAWHANEAPGMAYNVQQLQTDLAALKTIIREANEAGDYVFVLIG